MHVRRYPVVFIWRIYNTFFTIHNVLLLNSKHLLKFVIILGVSGVFQHSRIPVNTLFSHG